MFGAPSTFPRMHRRGLIPVLLACTAAHCDGSAARWAQVEPAASVVVRPVVVRLRAGEAAQLAAQVNDSTGRPIGGADLTYETSTPRLVRISPSGAVSSLGPVGDGSIRVASGSTFREVPVVVAAGVPGAARFLGGVGQTGEAGSTLPEPVVITISDAFGNVVPQAEVRFTAGAGGSTEPEIATTDVTGVARAIWTLGTGAGPQTLQARAGEATAVMQATAAPGRMASIEQVGALVRRISVGDSVQVRLRVADRHGNGVSGVVVAFRIESGGGMVAPARVETGADGLAQTRWTTGTKAGLNTLRARAIDVRDTTIRVDVRTYGGPATAVELVRGSGQRAAAGAAVAIPPTIRVVDAHGNVVSAARVRFVASDSGTVEPPESVTDEEGRVTVSRWVLGAAGANVLAVIVDGVTDTLRITAQARRR